MVHHKSLLSLLLDYVDEAVAYLVRSKNFDEVLKRDFHVRDVFLFARRVNSLQKADRKVRVRSQAERDQWLDDLLSLKNA